jgi:transcription initiation factor TFIID subunit 10
MASSSGTKKITKTKETEEDLCDFYTALDAYSPTIPEAVTKYYMQKGGIMAYDPRMVKLISLAADKFLSETIHEARQMSLLRKQGLKQAKRKVADNGEILEIEDLERCLAEQQIILKRKKTMEGSWVNG